MAVTHLDIVIAIPNNDNKILAKEKLSGQSISKKCYKSVTFQGTSICNLLNYNTVRVAITHLYIAQQV